MGGFLRQYDRCNQVTTDDEKDIDANEPATECLKTSMKKDDGDNGKGPQAINFSSVFHAAFRNAKIMGQAGYINESGNYRIEWV